MFCPSNDSFAVCVVQSSAICINAWNWSRMTTVLQGCFRRNMKLTIFCESNNFQHLSKFWKYLIKNIKSDIINHIFNNNSKDMIRTTFRLLKTVQFFQSFLQKYYSDDGTYHEPTTSWPGLDSVLSSLWFEYCTYTVRCLIAGGFIV